MSFGDYRYQHFVDRGVHVLDSAEILFAKRSEHILGEVSDSVRHNYIYVVSEMN